MWRSSWPESSRSGFGSPDVPCAFPGRGLCFFVSASVFLFGFFFSQAGSGSESDSEEEVGDKGSR